MPWVVEMAGFDPVSETEKTVRFALGEGVAFTDASYAPGALMRMERASQRIEIGANGSITTGSGAGEITIANFPDSVWEEAPWDSLASWVWQNRAVSLFYVPAKVWADRVLVDNGVLQQPVVNLDVGGGLSSVLRFPIKDPRAALETPFQPVKYAGTNVGPVGVEGGEGLKGRPKPIIYGLVSNFSPPLVNDSLLIYQLADQAVTVICVRDGGAPLAAGTSRGSLASLQANDPVSGGYDFYAGAEGTFIRLGSSPIFGIACDADEATSEANQSHAQIWSRIRTARCGSTVDGASVTAADALDSAGAGFFWDGEVTQKDAIAEVLGSFSGYEVLTLAGEWSVAKLVIPTGTPVIELVQIGPTTRMKATSRKLRSLTKVRPSYAPDGAPPYRVNVKWGRNYTVGADLAGAVSPRLKEKFAEEYRITPASNSAIWDPVAQTGRWTNAPELTVDTAYQPGDDGITSPGAVAEAARLLALLGPMRGQYSTQHSPEVGDVLLPGQVVQATYPRMGLSSGVLFRILEAGFSLDENGPQADLVIGLQA